MSRSMKLGIAGIVAAFVFSLVATDDAEARHRRFGRHRRGGGCCGQNVGCYVPQPTCCGAVAAPSACPGGACGVAGGGYSGGYSAGYGGVQGQNGSTMPPAPGALNGQGRFDQSPTPAAPNGGATFREEQRDLNGAGQNGAARSPSDRPLDRAPAPPRAANGAGQTGGQDNQPPAPPPAPQDQ